MRISSLLAALVATGALLVANVGNAQESMISSDCPTGDCGTSGYDDGSYSGAYGGGGTGVCCDPGTRTPVPSPWGEADQSCRNPDGSLNANCIGNGRLKKAYPSPISTLRNARRDPFHPAPVFAYGRHGIDATRVQNWNYNQAGQYSWHGNYYHRQWGQPLALVVPPTASYQTRYSWGVGQTTSLPIYHQYGRPNPGGGAGPGGAGLSPTPYWPSNTDQFGVYPVRGPW